MKQSKWFMLAILLTVGMAACSSSPEGENVESEDATGEAATGGSETYNLETGVVFWNGAKPTGKHNGTVNMSHGDLGVENGQLVSGGFTIDMSTLVNTDLTAETGKTDLEDHLKSADFFDVPNHPKATFIITKVEPATAAGVTHNVTGDLTIKGNTKSVTIPAEVIIEGDIIRVKTPDFTINRTEWDLKYGSGTIGTLQDKLIYDEVGLAINMTAKKPQM
jgi:polyisoprenoid-binding protein YceI